MRRPFALMTAAAVTAGGFALTPPASPATIEAGSLTAEPSNIQRTEVCFTVHNIPDPEPQQVSGTMFHPEGYTGGGTALLLQHGAVAERSVWDGGRPGITGAVSIVEPLVRAGYVVFAIDRLGYGPEQGYGRSPYEGSGWTLTFDSYVEMTHEMVTQIREGAYRITADTCPAATAGRPVSKVVLIGQSTGAGIIELYATRYHDIDGIVPMVWANFGGSNQFFNEVYLPTLQEQWQTGNDYVYLFTTESCEKYLFYSEGVSVDVIAQVCGVYFGGASPPESPSDELSSLLASAQVTATTIGNVGPTPVLLVFGDRDLLYPTAREGDDDPESDKVTGEIEYWTTNPGCNCDVELLWQRNSGHHNISHDSATEMTADVIEWLRSRGL